MLYLLTGSDILKAKERARMLAKGMEIVHFGEGNNPPSEVRNYLSARGLFAKETALIIDRPCETTEGMALLTEHMLTFIKADARVIVIEPVLPSAVKKKIPKAATVELYDISYSAPKIVPNVFALPDAFASGDRKKTWILYRKYIENGMSPEEIHGVLSWQARALVLATKTNSAVDAGLKPFVYTKAKRASARFKENETEILSRELVSLYHQSRMGHGALENLLEVFLLQKS